LLALFLKDGPVLCLQEFLFLLLSFASLYLQDGLVLCSQGANNRLVLDLRNNGGGLFPAGVQLGRLLLESGEIVLISDNQVQFEMGDFLCVYVCVARQAAVEQDKIVLISDNQV
jgi:hypothetical protein